MWRIINERVVWKATRQTNITKTKMCKTKRHTFAVVKYATTTRVKKKSWRNDMCNVIVSTCSNQPWGMWTSVSSSSFLWFDPPSTQTRFDCLSCCSLVSVFPSQRHRQQQKKKRTEGTNFSIETSLSLTRAQGRRKTSNQSITYRLKLLLWPSLVRDSL